MANENGDLILRIYRPVDTIMYPPPSVETGCFPYFLTNSCRNRSAISIVLSKEIQIPRIILSIGSIAIHSHTNSLRTLNNNVSYIINSDIYLLSLLRYLTYLAYIA